jgi:epoxide hydrolase 4
MVEKSFVTLPHGIRLSCRSAGELGRPVVVFLHGFPEGAFVWDAMLLYFSQSENGGFRCVAPNLRGYEKSSAPADVAAYRAKFLVQDIAALIASQVGENGSLACLVAHDWGGAVAWNVANQLPHLMHKLCIINSPHPGTFLRELANSPAQQASSAYMNFLIRPDAEELLAQDDYRRLWEFFTQMFANSAACAWLTDEVKAQYRAVWGHGLAGGCNYYRASPLRPPTPDNKGAAAVSLPMAMLTIAMPTLVLWGMADTALPPALLDGLEAYIPNLQLQRLEGLTHWLIHERPDLVQQHLKAFLVPS